MNLLFGEVVEVLSEDGMRMGRICVGGAQRKVAFELIQDAVPGDLVLLCDGVAISKVEDEPLVSGRVGVSPAGSGVPPERTSRTPRKAATQDASLGGQDAHPTRDADRAAAASFPGPR